MTLLLVLAGGVVGAPVRYLVDRWVQSWHESAFPWGTWVVNLTGSGLLGFLAASAVAGPVTAGVGIGFCGALTTYSTFGYETIRLLETDSWGSATRNVIASLVAGLGSAFGAAAVAAAVWG